MRRPASKVLFLTLPVVAIVALLSTQQPAIPSEHAGPAQADRRVIASLTLAAATSRKPVSKQLADSSTYLRPLAVELNKTWPKNRTINIVVHGHSVPAGYFNTPRVDTFNSYPHLIHVGLNRRYPNAVINVITTAIGGEASPAGSKRFERDVLPHRPDLLLIDYGLNDRGPGLERSEVAWRQMIETALEHEVPVILLTPTAALKAKMDDPQDPLNKHAELIRSLADEYGVGLADSTKAFKQAVANGASYRELMSQGVHPNRSGHELVATELLKWFPEK